MISLNSAKLVQIINILLEGPQHFVFVVFASFVLWILEDIFFPPPMSSVPQPIILVLLDIPPMLPVLDGVVMELQDCALPLLRGPLPISNRFTPSPKGCIKLRLILIQCSSTGTVRELNHS